MSNATSGNKRRFWRNEDGASAIEFAIVFWVLLLVTFGVIEFGYMLFRWNSAEKATELAVRQAVVNRLVATGLSAVGKVPADPADYGESCTQADGTPNAECYFDKVTCTVSACGAYGFDAAARNAILTQAQRMMPDLTADNVQIDYAFTGLGFLGRPNGQPVATTVRLVNLKHDTLILDVMGVLDDEIDMPEFAATMIGEDQG